MPSPQMSAVSKSIGSLSLYRPVWTNASKRRVPGVDEDELTMVVAAVAPLVGGTNPVDRIVVVSRAPAMLEGDPAAVIAHAVGRPQVPVQHVLGSGPEVLDCLAGAAPGTVVVGVEAEDGAGAGAIHVAGDGPVLNITGHSQHSVPIRVRRPGDTSTRTYADPRLLREVALRPALADLKGAAPGVAVGVPASMAPLADASAELSARVEVGGAAGVPFALAEIAGMGEGRVVAVEQGRGAAALLDGRPEVVRDERPGLPRSDAPPELSPEIPISLAAYVRAFDAKVGLMGAMCASCGSLSYPPRHLCESCRVQVPTELVPLPREAEIYTMTTVRTRVPGLSSPYSLAIVQLDGVDVRVLAPVVDSVPGSSAIGDSGRLVLRRVAVRQGVGDYGFAFRPAPITRMADA